MKTNFFKKSTEIKKTEMSEMSKEELNAIQGGTTAYIVRDPDGTVRVVIKP